MWVATKQFLKLGGIILCNGSHGDATLARFDEDFKFIGIVLIYFIVHFCYLYIFHCLSLQKYYCFDFDLTAYSYYYQTLISSEIFRSLA
jgi:hypothetical protein